MPPLAAIERFFERLFERPSARLFRMRLQPLQLQRRIERAMEAERRVSLERTLVPNRFIVHLHPDDLAAFGEVTGAIAVDMEGAAFYRTVADFPGISGLLVKAVCDFADPDKDDTYHRFAAEAKCQVEPAIGTAHFDSDM